MYRRFQDRFGTAGLVIAVIALIAALGGTALAAKGALTGKQRKEVEKIAKKYAGTDGAPGAPGKDGTNGTNGGPGKEGPEGKQGIQGIAGEDGETGFTDTLPSGKTETGAWAWGPVPKEITEAKLPISFPIPMELGTELKFHYVTEEEGEEGLSPECPGTVTEPAAKPGNACMYEAFGTGTSTSIGVFNPETSEAGKLGTTGAIITFFGVEEKKQGRGTWAATAP